MSKEKYFTISGEVKIKIKNSIFNTMLDKKTIDLIVDIDYEKEDELPENINISYDSVITKYSFLDSNDNKYDLDLDDFLTFIDTEIKKTSIIDIIVDGKIDLVS